MGPKNVTVNAILPGVFPSKMTAYGIKKLGGKMARAQPTGVQFASIFFANMGTPAKKHSYRALWNA